MPIGKSLRNLQLITIQFKSKAFSHFFPMSVNKIIIDLASFLYPIAPVVEGYIKFVRICATRRRTSDKPAYRYTNGIRITFRIDVYSSVCLSGFPKRTLDRTGF